jgi:HK97 family phage major capsid protein
MVAHREVTTITIAQRIGQLDQSVEQRARANEFLRLARIALMQNSPGTELRDLAPAYAARSTERVKSILAHDVRTLLMEKAAQQPMSTTSAAALTAYEQIAAAFAQQLVGSGSVFDAVLQNGALQMPLHTRVAVITGSGTGAAPLAELQAKPATEFSLDAGQLTPQKGVALVVISKELAQFSAPAAEQIFNTALTTQLVREVDSTFLAAVIAATTPTASAGSTSANAITDLTTLLGKLDIGPGSNVFWAMSYTRATAMSLMTSTNGGRMFPNLGPTGGELMHSASRSCRRTARTWRAAASCWLPTDSRCPTCRSNCGRRATPRSSSAQRPTRPRRRAPWR